MHTRFLNLCFLSLLCLLLGSSGVAAEPNSQGTLYWGNGDSLKGQLQTAKGDTLTWKSPLFADPLQLDLAVLSAVRFPEPDEAEKEPLPIDDGFRITLVNNNVLSGELVSVSEDTITFSSLRHGKLVLRKDGIRNLERKKNKGLVYLGPRGLDGWTQNVERKDLPPWKALDDGSLITTRGESSLARPMKLPKRCEIEFVLSSSSIPDFVITFGNSGTSRPRLEMWGDSFVARSERDFVELQVVPEGLRKLHCFAFIDFDKSIMAVYSHTGEKLGELQAANWEKLNSRISIEAIDSDLTLKHLRISEWDGTLPKTLIEGQSRVHTSSGAIHYGKLVAYSGEAKMLQVKVDPTIGQPSSEVAAESKPDSASEADVSEDEAKAKDEQDTEDESAAEDSPEETAEEPTETAVADVVEIPLDEIVRVVLSTEEKQTNDKGKTVVAWRNGGFISGNLVSIDGTSIALATDSSPEPITSSFVGVRRIGLPNTDVPEEEPDRLFFDGGSLRGNLTVEDHEIPIRWTPVGGRNATTLVSGGNARFQRGAEPEEMAIDSEQFPDVVYLHDGHVFPCRTETCDDKTLRLVSPVSEVRQLNLDLIKAVEFGNSDRGRQQGFVKEDWSRVSGSVGHEDEAIWFTTSASYGHESVLTGDSLSFRIRWKATCYGNLTFHLYSEKLKKPESSTTVNLALQPTRVVVSANAPNANGRMGFFGGGNAKTNGAVSVTKREIQVEMVARDGKVHVLINGKEAKVIELNTKGAGAKGMLISTAITSVNSRNAKTLKNDFRGLLEIDEFLVRNVVGASVKQFIQEEARERALTVPRFRRDDPPTHVLLAPNGDLLRGRLNSVTADEIVFESRLETFRFPRKRVAAVIWLGRDEEAVANAPARPATAVQAKLDNGFMLTMTPDHMADGQLVGHSQQLGVCRIPAKAIRDLFLGSPDGREEILSYVRWIRHDAAEPEWEQPEEGGDPAAMEMVGQKIDDFELPTLDGDVFRLSDHEDKVIVLDFWATWCGPCVAALPEYVNATSDFKESEAVFVAVNLEEPPERIKEFLSRHDLSPTVALDRGSVIARRFQVSGIPHSVVIGPGGVIKHVTIGYKAGVGAKTRERIEMILNGHKAE